MLITREHILAACAATGMSMAMAPGVASANEDDCVELATTVMDIDTSVASTVDPAPPIQPGDHDIERTAASPPTRVHGDYSFERTDVPNASRAVPIGRLAREERQQTPNVIAIPRVGAVFAACVMPSWRHSLPPLFVPIALPMCLR